MDRDELDIWWALHLEGHPLAEAQVAALLAALRDDPQLRQRFLDQRALHGELAQLGRSDAMKDSFAQRLQECLAAEHDAPDFVRRLAQRLPPPRRRRSWSGARRTALAVGLAAALVIAALLPQLRRAEAAATIVELAGECSVVRAGRTSAIARGSSVMPEDALMTAAGATAVLRYADGTTLRLGEGADLALSPGSTGKVATLRRGVIEAHVAAQPAGHPLSLLTAEATTTVVGTRFTLVAATGVTRLTVHEGLVRFTAVEREPVEVAAGQFAIADGRRAPAAMPLAATPLPAFPGAEGFGCDTVGGRGGRVIEVRTLADSGPGSFRAACLATGPRIIVFRTGGTIALSRPIVMTADNSFATIAGQSAPGGGVQLTGWDLTLTGGIHDVVIRHLRLRPGMAGPKEWNKHCVAIEGATAAAACFNIVIDHCSLQWGPNQSVVVWGHVRDVTIQWCLTEGLDPGPDDGAGGAKGINLGADPGSEEHLADISLHHCYLADCTQFNPTISARGPVHVVDNVVYNWRSFGTGIHDDAAGVRVNLIGNVYRRGPDSDRSRYAVGIEGKAAADGLLYVRDNRGPFANDHDDWSIVGSGFAPGRSYWSVAAPRSLRRLTPWPDPPIPVTITASQEVADLVLAGVGATAPARDAADRRVIEEWRQGTGSIRRASGQRAEWWPDLDAGTAPDDRDHDGMADAWELRHGLDPSDPTDGARDRDGDGYTNVEEYLNR